MVVGDGLRRGAIFLAAILALCALLALAPIASGAGLEQLWQRCDGGEDDVACNVARGVAVDPTNGHVYLADQSNHRIVEYTAWGELVKILGWGVVAAGPGNEPRNEIQQVTVAATEGSFTLSSAPTFFFKTPLIPYDATAAQVQGALENQFREGSTDPSPIQPGDVSVSGPAGGPWDVEFTGAKADEDVAALQANASDLGGGTATIATTQIGGRYEVCLPDMGDVCRGGQEGTGTGQLGSPRGLAVDSTGNLYTVDRDNRRVQKFNAAGDFVLMFGGNVNKTKVEAAAPEAQRNLCTAASGDECQAGTQGTGNGQFGAWTSGSFIAVGPPAANTVYVGDQGRVQRFNPSGEYLGDLPNPEGLLTGSQVQSLAMGPANSLYLAFAGKANVTRVNATSGAAVGEACEVAAPTALAMARNATGQPVGDLYVFDDTAGGEFAPPPSVRRFNAACVDKELPFAEGEVDTATGLAAGGAACFANPAQATDVYLPHASSTNGFLRAYGPAPNKELPNEEEACPRPPRPPRVADQYALFTGATEARVRAEINPRFWETEYWVQYAPAACVGAEEWEAPCVLEYPAPERAVLDFSGDGPARSAAVQLTGLIPDTSYRFRFAAQSDGDEEPVFGLGGEVGEEGAAGSFHTLAAPPGVPGGCANEALRQGAATFLPDCRAYEMVSPLEKEAADTSSGIADPFGVPEARNQSDTSGEKLTFAGKARFCDAVSQPTVPQYIATRHERGTPGEGWSCHGISPPRGVISGLQAGQSSEFRAFTADLCTAWVKNDDTTAPPLAPGGAEDDESLYERDNCGAGADTYRALWPDTAGPQGFTAGGDRVIFRTGAMVYLNERGGVEAQEVCVLLDLTLAGDCSAGMAGGVEQRNSLTHALSADGERVFWTARSSGPGPLYVRENVGEPQSELEFGSARGTGALSQGSTEVTNLTTVDGEFKVGQSITGLGIPYGVTIEAVGPASLTLSAPASETRPASPFNPLSAHSECTEPEKACTVAVSEAVDLGDFLTEQATRQATFWAAAADGSAALFSFDPDSQGGSPGPAGPDLYRFEVASRTPVLIAHDTLGVLGASEDLSRIYFVSTDALTGEGEGEGNDEGDFASEGEPNLYLHEAGSGNSVTFVATLAAADARSAASYDDPSPVSVNPTGHSARVSLDGGTAAFTSIAPLTGYDNRDAESGEADKEVFRYAAASGKLVCVSCHPSGARPAGRHVTAGPQNYWAAALIGVAQHPLYYPRTLSANGNRLFFESFEALVQRDTNGQKDVYQWEAPGEGTCTQSSGDFSPSAEGCVSLISSGTSTRDSSFLDADPDGSDVFFSTAASLVGTDPGLIDVYDARVQGGFPEPEPPAPPCEGDACQSAPPPPESGAPASSAFQGPGDMRPAKKRRCPKGKRRVRRAGKQRCVKKRKNQQRNKRTDNGRRGQR